MAKPASPTGSFAVNRVNRLLGRVFSVTAPIVGLQMFVNAFSQAHLLNPLWFWPSVSIMIAIFVAMLISVWWFDKGQIWYLALTIATAVILATWEFQVAANAEIPDNFHPWIWWAVGISAISAFGAFGPALATVFSFILPALYFVIHTRPLGGGASTFTTAQDVALSFLFAGTVSSLVLVLRYEASKVDLANQRATQAAVAAATSAAIDAERARVDALVHDSVLTTLLVSAKAQNADEERAAAQLATEAIARLDQAQVEWSSPNENISIASLFAALESSINKGFPGVEVRSEGASDVLISGSVASAVTGATLQAVSNSITHAGVNVKRSVSLRATSGRIKIVIKDNGRGFRPSRAIKSRLGLRLSIIDRVESVGGRVFIDAKPNVGATIIIEWGRN